MSKTPDVAQLSTCCGKPLVWDYRRCEEPGCTCAEAWWDGTCPMCGCLNADAMMSPERNLMPTEQMLLARIAALEEAQRWRVTAEEMPPVGVEVLARFANKPHVYIWQPSGHERLVNPVFWLPIPGVPDGR